MSEFLVVTHPSSSHFLKFSIIPWIAYTESDMIFSTSPSGLCLRLLLLPLTLPFDLSVRVWVFLEHVFFLFHLPYRISLLQLSLLRCFPQGTLYLYIESIASV